MEVQVIEKTNGRINRVTGTTIKERLRVCAYCINDKIKVTKKGKIKITKNGYFFDTKIIV